MYLLFPIYLNIYLNNIGEPITTYYMELIRRSPRPIYIYQNSFILVQVLGIIIYIYVYLISYAYTYLHTILYNHKLFIIFVKRDKRCDSLRIREKIYIIIHSWHFSGVPILYSGDKGISSFPQKLTWRSWWCINY